MDARDRGILAFIFLTLLFWITTIILLLPGCSKIEKTRKLQHQKKVDDAKAKSEKLDEEYGIKLQEYCAALTERDTEIEKYQAEQRDYETKLEEANAKFEADVKGYEDQLKQNKKLMAVRQSKYLQDFADYKAKVLQVQAFRQEIWARARMCIRCGSIVVIQT